ncbi:N-acyl-D-amino-acid deacylase family protein [Roseiterribacter gracilis]|uniref:Aminoacylase n=1 Tax=Roseiterribacter gracilis TaxID=2812848 RepID=A0A8S8X9H6_9PROT|nr:aminoacylase [Rhodospirillales bacterium TMPK1]
MAKRNLALIVTAIALASCTAFAAETPDLILRHGTILDGSGAPRFQGDVAVTGGRISGIGDLSKLKAKQEIDATGLFVTPGFINIHDHAQIDGVVKAENMLTQGVTTEIINPDGGGIGGTNSTALDQQLAQLSAHGLGTNFGAFIGFNAVWQKVVGDNDRRPSKDEIAYMQDIIVRNLEYGAFGVSAGLDYKPGYFAKTQEVIEIASAARKWRTNFPNHERLTPENGLSSMAGMKETVEISEAAGLYPEITHMKLQGQDQGKTAALFAMLDAATARGHYAPADAYPYVAGATGLGALTIPAWGLEGGRSAFLERAKDPVLRKKMADEATSTLAQRFNGADGTLLPTLGKKLSAYMAEEKIDTSGEAIIHLLEKQNMGAVFFFGNETDLVKILQYPATAIACDCGAVAGRPAGHPRTFGTFPRFLGRYVRDQKIMDWETAIAKTSGLPAATIGLTDRGLLGVGMVADIAVFDPAKIIDNATYENPAVLSDGVRYLLVNGVVALKDGAITDAKAGKPLRRTQNMPTRKLTTGDRSASGTFDLAGGSKAELQLSQKKNANRASGSFSLSGKNALTIKELGVLQAAKGWISFSGRARFADGHEELVTVIVDSANPLAPAGSTSVTIDGDTFHFKGAAPKAQLQVRL